MTAISRFASRKNVIQQATCAAILAASFATGGASESQAAATSASLLAGSCLAMKASTVTALQRYCLASWRQAGIPTQEWDDCTHEVVVEFLSRLDASHMDVAMDRPDSDARRELVRSIWCVTQRSRRARAKATVSLDAVGEPEESVNTTMAWESVEPLLESLNSTQRTILHSLREGSSIAEIAAELKVPAARVSDQKYKAIKKLQNELAAELTCA